MIKTEPKITTREQLVSALTVAAELEHLLCCSYLFSTLSLRRTVDDFPEKTDPSRAQVVIDAVRPWLWQMLTIARQEMEHLGIVQNLRAAIGADPYFDRPAFPQLAGHLLPAPIPLGRFNEEALRLFVTYERPDYLNNLPFATAALSASDAGQASAVRAMGIVSVQELYEEISAAFDTIPAATLFTGNPELEVPTGLFGYQVSLATVTNREEAQAAIYQIVSEGEGIGLNPLTSGAHFQKYAEILADLEVRKRDKQWLDPAFPVIMNPWVGPAAGHSVNPVTEQPAADLMSLFNDTYTLMLQFLGAFFRTYSASLVPPTGEQTALNYSAFFPLMTMAVRPLAELIVRTPAGGQYPGQTAGPSFQITHPVAVKVEPECARDQLTRLADRARDLANRKDVPAAHAARLRYIAENLNATAGHTRHIWKYGS